MKIEKTITDLMIEDHCRLERLLSKIEENIGQDYKLVIDVFDEFKWELEKHIFIEEKAVFKFFNPQKEKNYYDVVPNLIEEHNALLEMLNELENDLTAKGVNNISLDASDFKKLLKKHKRFEEEEFYPDLEKDLTESQRKNVIKKIKDSFPGIMSDY
jgi:hemerythrin-like domain-containing protein